MLLTTDSKRVLNISITGVSFCLAAKAAFIVSIATARSGVDGADVSVDGVILNEMKTGHKNNRLIHRVIKAFVMQTLIKEAS